MLYISEEFIDGSPLYESDDIISWLRRNPCVS